MLELTVRSGLKEIFDPGSLDWGSYRPDLLPGFGSEVLLLNRFRDRLFQEGSVEQGGRENPDSLIDLMVRLDHRNLFRNS